VTIEPETAEKLLLKRLGVKSLDILQKEWYAYIKGLQVTEVDALEMAGRYMARSGRRKEAKDMLSRAVSQGAKTPQTYSVYARLLSRSSEREEALRMISKAIELDPLEGSHYFEKSRILGATQGSKRDTEQILKLLGMACELEPENLEYAIAREIELEAAREEEADKKKDKGGN
jgi:tetratricopeptide (TPR) repeat protein